MIRLFLGVLLLIGATAFAPSATAQPAAMEDVVRITVLPGWRREDGVHVAALKVDLSPGWKTYWRSAGAAGIAPQFDWRATRGARSVTPSWPTPRAFGPLGARSIGYQRDFILPLLVAAEGAGPVHLRGELDFGVCAEICIPARVQLAAVLPARGGYAPEIAAALADRPRRIDASARCGIRPTHDGLVVTADLRLKPRGGPEIVVFEVPDPSVWVGDATVRRAGEHLQAKAEIVAAQGRPLTLDRSRLRITVIGDRGAVEVMGCAN
ncbi:hypothetical protein MWU52_09240 [Jannaschia sp. S6380]|uniref:protein-disulfide reductase DsbD domain-containing protein n=1 Tax=Jannaschia sp. S6380 TaxID=2926408 RepID=UPI001FF5449D|nr:protein-disulfide reductase DsbD domain-containing protein [Jannaschia sp. S6380]MCK0167728.1 hypothetical protein [Jannaschia sp. S6380]